VYVFPPFQPVTWHPLTPSPQSNPCVSKQFFFAGICNQVEPCPLSWPYNPKILNINPNPPTSIFVCRNAQAERSWRSFLRHRTRQPGSAHGRCLRQKHVSSAQTHTCVLFGTNTCLSSSLRSRRRSSTTRHRASFSWRCPRPLPPCCCSSWSPASCPPPSGVAVRSVPGSPEAASRTSDSRKRPSSGS